MAAKDECFRPMEVFWTCEDSDNDVLPISGKTRVAKVEKKKGNAVKGKKTSEVKAAIPSFKQPAAQKLVSPPPLVQTHKDEGTNAVSVKPKTSLRDLCREDKQRVANLIKELARVGEEKESVREQLERERQEFEKELQSVLSQQEKVLNEREIIQEQLVQCQAMLSRYQNMAREKQTEEAGDSVQSPKSFTPAKGAQLQNRDNEQCNQNCNQNLKMYARKVPDMINQSLCDRPFTSMIDKMIEDEKLKSRNLQPGDSGFHNSQTKTETSGEFQPLQPDPPSVNGHSQSENLPSAHQALERTRPMTDEQFASYYKNLSPFERKRQLKAQKAALLEEQKSLKSMLADQEKLLKAKQDQLHMQQAIQRERLKYFERTGYFPPHDPNLKLPFVEKEPFQMPDQFAKEPQSGHYSDDSYPRPPVQRLQDYPMRQTPVFGPFPDTPSDEGFTDTNKENTPTWNQGLPKPVFYDSSKNDTCLPVKRSVATSPLRSKTSYSQYLDTYKQENRDVPVILQHDDDAESLLSIIDEVVEVENKHFVSQPQEGYTGYHLKPKISRLPYSNSDKIKKYIGPTKLNSDKNAHTSGEVYLGGFDLHDDVEFEEEDEELEESRVLEEVFFVK